MVVGEDEKVKVDKVRAGFTPSVLFQSSTAFSPSFCNFFLRYFLLLYNIFVNFYVYVLQLILRIVNFQSNLALILALYRWSNCISKFLYVCMYVENL